MKVSATLLLSSLAATISALPSGDDEKTSSSRGLQVKTSSGLVRGTVNATTPNVRQFLGIPYAEPPVGPLRWQPPTDLVNTERTIEATSLPNACLQIRQTAPGLYTNETGFQYLISTPVSEDCLTLSVWAPPAQKSRNLPVLVFIHGGGFVEGGTSVPYQIPANWVQRSQSHIVVGIQYRLGVFGFPSAAGLDRQNPGLLDQRKAVEWVSANIASFGGDPKRITLWGQSAGAASIDYYNFAYPANPIVSSFILDSGTVFLPITNGNSSTFSSLATKLNCAGSPAAELACLRALPANTLLTAAAGLGFNPTIDNRTVFADYTSLYAKDAFARVPAIYGSNKDEDMMTFLCPLVTSLVDRTAAPTKRTTFTYQYWGNFSNVSPNGQLAYHSSELPLLFGTSANLGPNTPLEEETSRDMQDFWVAFASDPQRGLQRRGWGTYEDEKGVVLGDVRGMQAVREVRPPNGFVEWLGCPGAPFRR
ncbi:Carboxylesterase-like protein 1 [Elsinoe fawcettii]|nr:Carboxylesterase-like protein 1 [Elsinoe fawcettii]